MIAAIIMMASSGYLIDRSDALGLYMRCAKPIIEFYPPHADIQYTIDDVRKYCGKYRDEAIKIFIPLWQIKGKFKEPIKDEDAAETTILSAVVIELMKKEEAANQQDKANAPYK